MDAGVDDSSMADLVFSANYLADGMKKESEFASFQQSANNFSC